MRKRKQLVINNVERIPPDKQAELQAICHGYSAKIIPKNVDDINRLYEAIYVTLGFNPCDLKSNRRHQDLAYARQIFLYHAQYIYRNYTRSQLGTLVNLKHNSVKYCLDKYNEQKEGNDPVFVQLVHRVNVYMGLEPFSP